MLFTIHKKNWFLLPHPPFPISRLHIVSPLVPLGTKTPVVARKLKPVNSGSMKPKDSRGGTGSSRPRWLVFVGFIPPFLGVMGSVLFLNWLGLFLIFGPLPSGSSTLWLIKGDQKMTYESWDCPARISALLSWWFPFPKGCGLVRRRVVYFFISKKKSEFWTCEYLHDRFHRV